MVAQTQVVVSPTDSRRDSMLRRGLVGNVIFSVVTGTLLVAGSGRISDFTGLKPGWVPAVVGAGVLLWALEVGLLARQDELKPSRVWMIIGGDLAWVFASYAMLIFGVLDLTTAGAWSVAIVAELVGLFAIVQYLGLRRMRAA